MTNVVLYEGYASIPAISVIPDFLFWKNISIDRALPWKFYYIVLEKHLNIHYEKVRPRRPNSSHDSLVPYLGTVVRT